MHVFTNINARTHTYKHLRRRNTQDEESWYSGPLRDFFQQLVIVLWEHIRYPELIDRDNVLDPTDDFYHFRTNAAHLVFKVCNYVCGVVSSVCVRYLCGCVGVSVGVGVGVGVGAGVGV